MGVIRFTLTFALGFSLKLKTLLHLSSSQTVADFTKVNKFSFRIFFSMTSDSSKVVADDEGKAPVDGGCRVSNTIGNLVIKNIRSVEMNHR